jgi:uncharacterized protein (TIGR02266 family)
MSDKLSVLIICRSAAGQMYLGVLLNRIWFSPVLARTVEEGIRLAQTMPFCVVLLDGDMAELELQTALTILKADPVLKNLPTVIFLTDDNPTITQSLLDQGCAAVLIKPLDLTMLYRMLHSLSGQPRYTPRVRVKIRVKIQEGTPEKFLSSVDISEGGIYLRTIAPLPEGAVIHVKFTLPHDTEAIELAAKVVRTLPLAVQLQADPGMGLSFIDTPEDTRVRIRNFVQWELTGDLDWKPDI